MGMDVYGLKPSTPTGEYFRNNVWFWRPLWTYIVDVYRDQLPNDPDLGFYNDGYAVGANEADALARALFNSLDDGSVDVYAQSFHAKQAAEGLEPCSLCNSTGVRTDAIAVAAGMPTQELDEVSKIILGRDYGTCNACNGHGSCPSPSTWYSFTVDNLRDFAAFVADSGGFEIY